jgi:hypothetical protein
VVLLGRSTEQYEHHAGDEGHDAESCVELGERLGTQFAPDAQGAQVYLPSALRPSNSSLSYSAQGADHWVLSRGAGVVDVEEHHSVRHTD